MKTGETNHNITVQSSNVGLGEALPQRAREAILKVADKYFGHLSSAAVHFSKDGHSYRCTVDIHMGALKHVIGEASEADCHKAFDHALERAAKQLRRMKREVRDDKRHRGTEAQHWAAMGNF